MWKENMILFFLLLLIINQTLNKKKKAIREINSLPYTSFFLFSFPLAAKQYRYSRCCCLKKQPHITFCVFLFPLLFLPLQKKKEERKFISTNTTFDYEHKWQLNKEKTPESIVQIVWPSLAMVFEIQYYILEITLYKTIYTCH
jgi:hypothetical protein